MEIKSYDLSKTLAHDLHLVLLEKSMIRGDTYTLYSHMFMLEISSNTLKAY